MRRTKEYKIEFTWFGGFVEKFTCTPLKKNAERWYNQGMQLNSIVHISIVDTEGNSLYNIKKESPYAVKEKPKKKRVVKKRSKKRG